MSRLTYLILVVLCIAVMAIMLPDGLQKQPEAMMGQQTKMSQDSAKKAVPLPDALPQSKKGSESVTDMINREIHANAVNSSKSWNQPSEGSDQSEEMDILAVNIFRGSPNPFNGSFVRLIRQEFSKFGSLAPQTAPLESFLFDLLRDEVARKSTEITQEASGLFPPAQMMEMDPNARDRRSPFKQVEKARRPTMTNDEMNIPNAPSSQPKMWDTYRPEPVSSPKAEPLGSARPLYDESSEHLAFAVGALIGGMVIGFLLCLVTVKGRK
jgi:hypothetical protein